MSSTLSADGNTMAVSAYFEASGAKGINGNQADDSIPQAGAVYVFTRRGTTWSQQAYIKASNTGEAGTDGNFGDGDQFGFALSLSDDGNTIAVGANAEDSNATGINGNQADNSMQSAGAVYVFTRTGTTWTQQAYVKPANTFGNIQFGYSVALSADGNTLAASAFDEGGASRAINGPYEQGTQRIRRRLRVHAIRGTTWTQQAIPQGIERGGERLARRGRVDQRRRQHGRVGLARRRLPGDRCQSDAAHATTNMKTDTSTGAAYVFVRSGTNWTQQAFIKASNTGKNDWFGSRLQTQRRRQHTRRVRSARGQRRAGDQR